MAYFLHKSTHSSNQIFRLLQVTNFQSDPHFLDCFVAALRLFFDRLQQRRVDNLTSPASALHSPASGFRPNELKATLLSLSYASVVNGNGRVGEEVVEEEFESRNLKRDDELYDLGLHGHRFLNSHKRSSSLSDAAGFGSRSSLGSGGVGGASSLGKFDEFEQEMLRSRATQHQRLALASQIMPGSFPYNNKYFDGFNGSGSRR